MSALAVFSTDVPPYGAASPTGDDAIIAQALAILQARVKIGVEMTSVQTVRDFFTCRASKSPNTEVFTVMFLDAGCRMIECRDMSIGTVSECRVYPRELVRAALELHATSIILSHNHPSGNTKPSRADEMLTAQIKTAMALVDVRVLDHIITAGGSSLSMAETGLM